MLLPIRSHFVVLVCLSLAVCAAAAEPTARQQDEQLIRKTAREYLAALGRGDAKAAAEFWTADGDVVDESGRSFPAREIMAALKPAGEGAKSDLKLTANSIRFLTPDVALEEGTSEVAHRSANDLPAIAGRFTVVWVKRDGKWRLASLRESRVESPPSASLLADLDWMTGQWSGTAGDTLLEISAHWNPTHTYLLRDLKVLREGQVVFHGAQRIGWDPLSRKIKSWVFDTDGGHGEGIWTKAGDAWVVQANGVLGDGRQTASTNVYTPVDENSFRWKSIAAPTEDEGRPGLDITLVRKPASR